MAAQDAATGALRGAVHDLTGHAVPGSRVTVRNNASGVESEAAADSVGEFAFGALEPGGYTVSVMPQGQRERVFSEVAVTVGRTTTLDVSAWPMWVQTTVRVDASGPVVLSLEDSAVNSVVAPDEVSGLPIDGRRWQSFALLTPTANAADDEQLHLSFRGIDQTQNGNTLDGLSDSQRYLGEPRGGLRLAYSFSQAAVREFQVNTAGYGALFGHSAGAIVNTVSRRGGATVHGSAFFWLLQSGLGATNPLSLVTNYNDGTVSSTYARPHDVRQQFGGTLGGPLWPRQKLFVFLAYEQQRRGFPAISTPDNPDFYRLSAMQTALLQNRGVALKKIDTALNYLNSLTGVVQRRSDETAVFPRVDWEAGEHHQFTLQWHRVRHRAPAGFRSEATVNRGTNSIGDLNTSVDAVSARWTWTPFAGITNGLRAQWSRDFERQQPQSPLPQEPQTGPNGFAPQVNIDDDFYFGKPSYLARKAYPDERMWQVADVMTWSHPGHTLSIGFDGSYVNDRIESLSNEEGSYDYSSGNTNGRAGGLVDWITDFTFDSFAYPNGGCPSIISPLHFFCFRSYSQGFGGRKTAFGTAEWMSYMQENWRVTPQILLTVGVRYEYMRLPGPQRPNAALDAVFGRFAATSSMPGDTNNLGPRAGMSWSPGGENGLVLRVGYGVYFGRLAGATIRSALEDTALPSSTYQLRLTPRTEIEAKCASAGTNFGYPATYACAPAGIPVKTTSAVVFARKFQLPMVQHAELMVERQVARSTTVSATYLLSLSRQLPNSVDMNIAPSTGTQRFGVVRSGAGIGSDVPGVRNGDRFTVPVYAARVSNDFGPVTEVNSNVTATYSAAVVELRRRMRRGLESRVSWTFAKALDYGQTIGPTPLQNGQFDPQDVRYDRAASALDRRQKIVASAVWEPSVTSERRVVQWMANGWSVAPLFYANSGRPYSFDIYGGSQLNGGRESINGSGGLTYLPSVGANTLRLPWTENLDLRVGRSFDVGGRGVQCVEPCECVEGAGAGIPDWHGWRGWDCAAGLSGCSDDRG